MRHLFTREGHEELEKEREREGDALSPLQFLFNGLQVILLPFSSPFPIMSECVHVCACVYLHYQFAYVCR